MCFRFARASAAWLLLAAALSTAATQPGWSETLRLRIGPDSNACGLTLPKRPGHQAVILWLHGGMRSDKTTKGWTALLPLLTYAPPGAYYLCSPSAFAGQDWLTPPGVAHIDALLDYIALHYPKARLRDLILVGVSDGCLGALHYAEVGKYKPVHFVLFSCFPPLAVPENELFTRPEYTTTRWDVFQGGHDRLFPAQIVFPLLRQWHQVNPKVTLHLEPDGEHDFSWWADHVPQEIRNQFAVSGPE